MDSYRMNCRNVSGNCRNRTCGNMTGTLKIAPADNVNGMILRKNLLFIKYSLHS